MRSPVESSMSNSRTFGVGRDLVGEVDQPVGRLAHRRDGADDAQAALLRLDEAARDVPDLVRIGDRRAAELHHDGVEVHGRSLPRVIDRLPGRRSAPPEPPTGAVPSGVWRPSTSRTAPATSSTATPAHGLHLERERVRELLARRHVLLARRPRPGGGRPRDPARRVRLPPALARGLVALRPAAEDRRLRRLRLPRRLRRLERRRRRRARRGALLLLRPLPRHAAPRRARRRSTRCASATSSGTRRSTTRRGSCTRSSTASSTASSRGSTAIDDRIDVARGGDLPRRRRGAAAGDLRDEARARRRCAR